MICVYFAEGHYSIYVELVLYKSKLKKLKKEYILK